MSMATSGINIDIDEADIIVLSQDLEKSRKLTYNIEKSLQRIVDVSSQSNKLFAPILTRNNQLTILQRNIESTLNSLSSVKDLANEASKYEIILSKGIQELGLKQYIQVIHKINDMLEDIKVNGEQNAEFRGIVLHLSDLIKSSEGNLRVYFVAMLNTIKHFDPQLYMNRREAFPYYDSDQLNELSTVLDYFFGNSDGVLIQTTLINERSEKILRCLAFLEPFAKQVTASKNAPYEKGSSGLLSYTEALLGFIAGEKSLMEDLFPQSPPLQQDTLERILTPILRAYSKLFSGNVKSVIANLENADIFSFELVECIQKVIKSLRFNSSLQKLDFIVKCSESINQVIQSLFKESMQKIAAKVNRLSTIPTDNGVTEPTVDTMSRLRKFSEFKNGCLDAIATMDRTSWLLPLYKEKDSTFNQEFLKNATDENRPLRLLSCFYSDCIDTLCILLDKKAQKLLSAGGDNDAGVQSSPAALTLNDPTSSKENKLRIGYFLLMNMSLVEQIIEKSDISNFLGVEGRNRLEKLQRRYIDYMVADWRDLTAILMDSIFIDSTGKKSKDKEQIKEKFKKFNEGFDELVATCKQYRLNDPSLKKTLKSEILSLLLPMYERFYGRYKDSFKNPRKHIKYNPGELTSVINQTLK